MRKHVQIAAAALGLAALGVVGGLGSSASPVVPGEADRPAELTMVETARPPLSAGGADLASVGKAIFFDKGLSEPPGTSCASCHDPAHGYAGNNGSPLGVARGSRPGHFAKRNTPSVLYLRFVRRFHFHWEEDAPLPDAFGGFFWDGRADSIAALVIQPLTNPDEMGNRDAKQVASKLAASAYADDLRREAGASDGDDLVRAMGQAVEAFLTSDELSPFSSKYDDYVRGRATLTPLEARGLALFKDPDKGACDSCHKLDDTSPNPARSLFTDYGYEAVAAPRNRLLSANRDPRRFDLGLCDRHDARTHTDEDRWCGSFRTPSLRNVATRPSFLHNGTFSKLRDVVAFYATRGTSPARWYAGGAAYDDLPPKYREYVNVTSPPYNRTEGEKPALDDGEIDAIVAFLETLTDADYR
jgi:cytochrome c peroxidase